MNFVMLFWVGVGAIACLVAITAYDIYHCL